MKKFGRLSQYTPQDGFQTLFFDLRIAAPGSASAVDAAGEGGVGGKRPSSASTRIDVQPPMIRRTKEEARLSGGACLEEEKKKVRLSFVRTSGEAPLATSRAQPQASGQRRSFT